MNDNKDDIQFDAKTEDDRVANMKARAVIRNHKQRIQNLLQNTTAGFRIVEDNVAIVAETMKHFIDEKTEFYNSNPKANHRVHWYKLIKDLPLNPLAEAALQFCLECVGKEYTYTHAAIQGGLVVRGQKFYASIPNNRKGNRIRKQFSNHMKYKNSRSDDRRLYALELAERKGWYFDDKYTENELIQMGSFIIECVRIATGLFDVVEYKKNPKDKYPNDYLVLREEFEKRLDEDNKVIDDSSAMLSAMTVEPNKWSRHSIGAYNDPVLCSLAPMIKNMGKEQEEALKEALKDGSMDECVKALNTLQSVPLSINPFILEAVEWVLEEKLSDEVESFPTTEKSEVPPRIETSLFEKWSKDEQIDYQDERHEAKVDNRTSVAERRILKNRIAEAKEMMNSFDNTFYLPHQFDNRGRVYYSGNFGHHAHDYIRSMIMFKNKEKVQGNEEFLALQLANSWGKGQSAVVKMPSNGKGVDKQTLNDRLAWGADHQSIIEECGRDYKATFEIWSKADAPFEFLAACREWYNYTLDPDNYETGLAIGLDATNSGVQHYSASCLSRKDGFHVNLTAEDEPQDLYELCLAKTAELVGNHIVSLEHQVTKVPSNDNEKEELEQAKTQLRTAKIIDDLMTEGKLGRKQVKRNVMTWAYSSKEFGFSRQLQKDWIKKEKRKRNKEIRKVREEQGDEAANAMQNVYAEHGFAMAKYLAKKNYQSVTESVKDAQRCMEFFQYCAELLANENKQVKFVTKLGFPLIQNYWKAKTTQPKVFLADRETLEIQEKSNHRKMRKYTDDVKKDKAMNAISPNIIHALDSTHLMMSVNKCSDAGINDLLVVHDCYSTTIGKAKEMSLLTREAFIELYDGYCVYEDLKEQTLMRLDNAPDNFKEIPPKGDLDINEVYKSDYFFS